MNYSQALAWLYSTQQHGIKLGLDNMRLLEAHFPPKCPCVIHVAGTNGKGSVCAMIDSMARAQGLTSGLYTSPHLISFRERIRVNGQMIPEEDVSKGLALIRHLLSTLSIKPTFFEITTALAFQYFARFPLDILVLETGMGGRLDATNVVRSSVSVITPIGIDHQQWLGNSLAEIAFEKAGIIKLGVPVVSAPQVPEARKVLEEAAAKSRSSIYFSDETCNDMDVGLPGKHQRHNAAVALRALKLAGIKLSKAAMRKGLMDVHWPGRFHRLKERFVLDGAHNPDAAATLVSTWKECFAPTKATVVLGILADKDQAAICRALLPISERFYVVPVKSSRTSDPTVLQTLLCDLGVTARAATDLKEAIGHATTFENPILITGSLFLVGEAFAILQPDTQNLEISAQ